MASVVNFEQVNAHWVWCKYEYQVDTRRHFNVYKTSIRRCIDVLQTLKRRRASTLGNYWVLNLWQCIFLMSQFSESLFSFQPQYFISVKVSVKKVKLMFVVTVYSINILFIFKDIRYLFILSLFYAEITKSKNQNYEIE